MDIKQHYLIIDVETGLTVTTMPKYDLCLDVTKKLPANRTYHIQEFTLLTKLLNSEFSSEIGSIATNEYYRKLDEPMTPDEWYGSDNVV